MKILQKFKIDNKDFIIRYLEAKDIKGIFNMNNFLYKEKAMTGMNEKLELKQIKKFVLNSLNKIKTKNWVDLVLENNKKIIGRAFIRRIDDPCQSHVASFGIHVLDFARGIGVSKKFFTTIEKEAKKILKIKIIILGVMACNKRAIRFYQKNGFNKVGITKGAIKYFNKYEDEILMAKYYK